MSTCPLPAPMTLHQQATRYPPASNPSHLIPRHFHKPWCLKWPKVTRHNPLLPHSPPPNNLPNPPPHPPHPPPPPATSTSLGASNGPRLLDTTPSSHNHSSPSIQHEHRWAQSGLRPRNSRPCTVQGRTIPR